MAWKSIALSVEGIRNNCCRFETWEISSTPLCPYRSDETLNAVGRFYMLSMPVEVKDPHREIQKKCGLSAPHRAGDLDM